MNPVASNPLLGVAMHAIGATFAATCYTPEKRVRGWSWQTYWITQASFCWLLLPIAGAMLTVPDLAVVLREAPKDAMWKSFLLGAAYGIGGTAFGISIRYIGFSLTYAIAVGLSSVLGTLIPPLVKGTLLATLHRPGAQWILLGILLREWRACRRLTHRTLAVALAVLITAVLLLTYGNYAGDSVTTRAETHSGAKP